MNRKNLVILSIAIAIAFAIVNATVFAYRWISGTVKIEAAGNARGAACTGFYSAAAQRGIGLPEYGTNYNAQTYGEYSLSITPGNVVCTWSRYYLYESIEVEVPITVGSWYIQDFYAFGYYGTEGDPTVYVYFRVDEDATDGGLLTTAKLYIWKDGTRYELNLLEPGWQTRPISLNPGEALRLDLYLDAANSGTVNFKVGVYVTQEMGESPNLGESP